MGGGGVGSASILDLGISSQLDAPVQGPPVPFTYETGGPQNRSGRCEEEQNLLPLSGIESSLSVVQPVAIPTERFWLSPADDNGVEKIIIYISCSQTSQASPRKPVLNIRGHFNKMSELKNRIIHCLKLYSFVE
jgi:hypothetical protein